MAGKRGKTGLMLAAVALAGVLGSLLIFMALFVALSGSSSPSTCAQQPAGAVLLGPGGGAVVGATEYGGPGDPSSGTLGSSGVNLSADPDSYAELGGTNFATATDMGGLAYGTPLRITWAHRSVIALKQDIGLGGGPIDGHPRVIDLWWQLASRLGIPYTRGLWSGTVEIQRTPVSGAGQLLAEAPQAGGTANGSGSDVEAASCVAASGGGLGVATLPGARAGLLPNGQAVAPADAPTEVKQMIAAGDQIVGKPYVYGGGHGLALSQIASAYDCSSSVGHLLWGGGLLGVTDDMTSGDFEQWGLPGPGRWVTLYASAEHVFMYVAGLRWDTHNAAGPADGSSGIGWHPLVREADGFVARHPLGL